MTTNTHRMVSYTVPRTGWEAWRLTDNERKPVTRKGRRVVGKAIQPAHMHGADCSCNPCRIGRANALQRDNVRYTAERFDRDAFEDRLAGYVAKAKAEGRA